VNNGPGKAGSLSRRRWRLPQGSGPFRGWGATMGGWAGADSSAPGSSERDQKIRRPGPSLPRRL